MHEDDPVSEKAIGLGLQPGEGQLFCPACDFTAEKNTAMKPTCPDCGAGLCIAKEKGD